MTTSVPGVTILPPSAPTSHVMEMARRGPVAIKYPTVREAKAARKELCAARLEYGRCGDALFYNLAIGQHGRYVLIGKLEAWQQFHDSRPTLADEIVKRLIERGVLRRADKPAEGENR